MVFTFISKFGIISVRTTIEKAKEKTNMEKEWKGGRGNQGWSTAGKAGRKPLPPDRKRRNRCLKATDAEWAKIKEFAKKLKGETENDCHD